MKVWSIVFCTTETECIFSSEEKARDYWKKEELEIGVYYLTVATLDDESYPEIL